MTRRHHSTDVWHSAKKKKNTVAGVLPTEVLDTILPPVVANTLALVAPTSQDVASNESSIAVTQPVSIAPTVVPPSSSSASSLPVGMGISLSSSQPAYQPMVVVNTLQLVRPYNGTTSWTSFREHFKRVAKVNRWDDNVTQAQHLMLALEGNAAEVLKEISDTSPTVLQDIWDALCRRFGEVDEAREAEEIRTKASVG